MKCASNIAVYDDASREVANTLDELPGGELDRQSDDADVRSCRMANTFLVLGREDGNERLIPFDVIQRVLSE